ncbi:hypothetical protein ACOWKQ_05775 [Helicobacter pylori]
MRIPLLLLCFNKIKHNVNGSNLKKETACVLKPANILKLHSAYTI